MGRPGFLNDNEYRDYPFITQAYLPHGLPSAAADELPASAVVDFGAIMGIDAEFDDTLDIVYLASVRRTVDAIEYQFRTTAPAAAAWSLVFSRAVDSDDWAVEHVDAVLLDSSASASLANGPACGDAAPWEGYMTSGTMSDIVAALPNVGDVLQFSADQWQIEPSRIQNLRKAFVRSISLANYDRTRVAPSPECGGDAELPAAQILLNAACLQGPLRLKEGFNCAIRQEDNTNTITISAAVGDGAGLACEEVPIVSGETPPPGSTTLTGGPRCTDIIKTINGVGGRIVRVFGGSGIEVLPDADNLHTLVVDVSLHEFAVCVIPEEVPLLSSSSAADN